MKNFIFIFLLLGVSHANAALLNDFTHIKKGISIQVALIDSSLTSAENKIVGTLDENVLSTNENNISFEKEHKKTNNNLSAVAPLPTLFWFIASAVLGIFGMKQMRGISPKSENI